MNDSDDFSEVGSDGAARDGGDDGHVSVDTSGENWMEEDEGSFGGHDGNQAYDFDLEKDLATDMGDNDDEWGFDIGEIDLDMDTATKGGKSIHDLKKKKKKKKKQTRKFSSSPTRKSPEKEKTFSVTEVSDRSNNVLASVDALLAKHKMDDLSGGNGADSDDSLDNFMANMGEPSVPAVKASRDDSTARVHLCVDDVDGGGDVPRPVSVRSPDKKQNNVVISGVTTEDRVDTGTSLASSIRREGYGSNQRSSGQDNLRKESERGDDDCDEEEDEEEGEEEETFEDEFEFEEDFVEENIGADYVEDTRIVEEGMEEVKGKTKNTVSNRAPTLPGSRRMNRDYDSYDNDSFEDDVVRPGILIADALTVGVAKNDVLDKKHSGGDVTRGTTYETADSDFEHSSAAEDVLVVALTNTPDENERTDEPLIVVGAVPHDDDDKNDDITVASHSIVDDDEMGTKERTNASTNRATAGGLAAAADANTLGIQNFEGRPRRAAFFYPVERDPFVAIERFNSRVIAANELFEGQIRRLEAIATQSEAKCGTPAEVPSRFPGRGGGHF
eukprot:g2334.t1